MCDGENFLLALVFCSTMTMMMTSCVASSTVRPVGGSCCAGQTARTQFLMIFSTVSHHHSFYHGFSCHSFCNHSFLCHGFYHGFSCHSFLLLILHFLLLVSACRSCSFHSFSLLILHFPPLVSACQRFYHGFSLLILHFTIKHSKIHKE